MKTALRQAVLTAIIVPALIAVAHGNTEIRRVVGHDDHGGDFIIAFPGIHVPIRWCALAGTAAVDDPGGVGEETTDGVLLRRLQRLNDAIWTPQAGLIFRSAVPAGVRASFPVIPDPILPAAGGPGQPGDIFVDPAQGEAGLAELRMAQGDCELAWQALEDDLRADGQEVNLEGPVVVNLRRFVDDGGVPILATGHGSFVLTPAPSPEICMHPGLSERNTGDAGVIDNATLFDDVRLLDGDPHDAALAHELGHVLFLGHGNGRDDNGDGLFDSFCDGAEDERAEPHSLMTQGSPSELITAAFVQPVGQLGTSRLVARVTTGAQVDPPAVLVNADTVSDHRADAIRDVDDSSIDIVTVGMTVNTAGETTNFTHELFGTIPPPGFPIPADRAYVVFADLDNDPATGGGPADLDFPTSFQGAELVTRIVVHYDPLGEFRDVTAAVWRFQNGGFVPMHDPGIQASVATSIWADGGAPFFDVAAIRVPNAVRGPAGALVRIQAIAVRAGKVLLDRVPDGAPDAAATLLLIGPRFPTAGTTPFRVSPGAATTLEARGLLPDAEAPVYLGGRPIATGRTNSAGELRIPLVVPGDVAPGFRGISVGARGSALTAEAVLEVAGPSAPSIPVPVDIKPGSCPNPLPTNARGVLPVAILGTPTLDVTTIDPARVTLEGIPALRSAVGDVATPFAPFLGRRRSSDCSSVGPDGVPDLVLKFDSQAVVAALGPLADGDMRLLRLIGSLKPGFGSAPIVGEDVVVVVRTGRQ